MPTVTVIVRSIDRSELQTALDSIAAQTYTCIDVLLVNAKGPDHRDVGAVCGRFPQRMVGCGTPMGRSRAANFGLQHANGDCIIFLDDDDWFLPHHIEALVVALQQNPLAGAAYSSVECVRSDNSGKQQRTYLFNQPFDRTRLLVENYIPMHAILFRRSLLDTGCRVDEHLDVYEDWDFWMQLAQHADFVFLEPIGAVYRIGPGSGFGINADAQEVTRGLAMLFQKWRPRWSDAQCLAIVGYAKYHSMYWEIKKQLEMEVHSWQARVSEVQGRLNDVQTSLFENQKLFSKVKNELLEAQNKLFEAQTRLLESENQGMRISDEIQYLTNENAQLKAVIQVQTDDLGALSAQMAQITGSKSWTLTAPLRLAAGKLRHCILQARVARVTIRQYLVLSFHIWRSSGTGALVARMRRKLKTMRRSARQVEALPQSSLEASYHPLTLTPAEAPLVSIIIPVHNKHLYTFTCLKSIVADSFAKGYEVIVVDDHSEDETDEMLALISGVRVVRNSGERGFVASCNLGAANATGEYLVFLNNDTIVQSGWLNNLLAVFQHFPSAGLVGARLVYPDGRLQEAGGIIWRDGSAWNDGRGDSADKPEYSYVREVDYCSAACVAIPRQLFEDIGRFSAEFSPAYYEDVDLAFKVRAANKRVYYQPAAKIVHFEGASLGTSTLSGLKGFQVLHRQKLHEKWKRQLITHRINGSAPHLERERGTWKRVLVVDKVMLTPDQDSGSLRMFKLLEELVGLHVKVVFATLYLDDREPYKGMLQQSGIMVICQPHYWGVREYLEKHGTELDAVLLSRVDVAEQLTDVVRQTAPAAMLLFDTVDLHFLREERMAELHKNAAMAKAAQERKQLEIGLMRKADVTLVVSSFEKELLTHECPDLRVEVVSNIHDIHGCSAGFEQREGLLFIGGFNHPPNVDAVLYFVREILPLVQQELGSVKTWIIGSNPTSEILELASDTVIVEGFVEDVSGHFAKTRLSIAPLRYGAGVKGKINMSMAYGVPVVATSMAAEGMSLTDGLDVMVGDDAQSFAHAVIDLYTNKEVWNVLSANSMRNIEQHFSRRVARQTLQTILENPASLTSRINKISQISR
ncbi:MAG: glycosyltransferase [Rhodoferax sp.]|nr:glycosyltransferase [Rhodoferax sp.]